MELRNPSKIVEPSLCMEGECHRPSNETESAIFDAFPLREWKADGGGRAARAALHNGPRCIVFRAASVIGTRESSAHEDTDETLTEPTRCT